MSQNTPLDPGAEATVKPNRKRSQKIVASLAVAAVIVGVAANAVVAKVSPALALVKAYDKLLVNPDGASIKVKLHLSADAITNSLGVSGSDIKDAGIDGVNNASDLSREIEKLSLEFASTNPGNKDKLASYLGLKYDGLEVLAFTLSNRVAYLRTQLYDIASQSPLVTKEQVESLADLGDYIGLNEQDKGYIRSFLKGTALSYTFEKGTRQGEAYDEAVAEAEKEFKKLLDNNLSDETMKLIANALKANSSIGKSTNDNGTNRIDATIKLPGFIKAISPILLEEKGQGHAFAQASGIKSKEDLESLIEGLPETLTVATWIKDGNVVESRIDLSKFSDKLDSTHADSTAASDATEIATMSDGMAMDMELQSIISDYTTFGEKSGTISLDKENRIVFSKMVNADEYGRSTSGPGVTASIMRFSTGTKLVDATFSPGEQTKYCFALRNGDTFVRFTPSKWQKNVYTVKTGSVLKCDPSTKVTLNGAKETAKKKALAPWSMYLSLSYEAKKDIQAPEESRSINSLIDSLSSLGDSLGDNNGDGSTLAI